MLNEYQVNFWARAAVWTRFQAGCLSKGVDPDSLIRYEGQNSGPVNPELKSQLNECIPLLRDIFEGESEDDAIQFACDSMMNVSAYIEHFAGPGATKDPLAPTKWIEFFDLAEIEVSQQLRDAVAKHCQPRASAAPAIDQSALRVLGAVLHYLKEDMGKTQDEIISAVEGRAGKRGLGRTTVAKAFGAANKEFGKQST